MADDDCSNFFCGAVPAIFGVLSFLGTIALFVAYMVTKFSSCNYIVTATVQDFIKPSNLYLWRPHECKVALKWYDEHHDRNFTDSVTLPSVSGCSGIVSYIQEQVALLLPPEEQPPPPGPGEIPLIHVRGCVNYFHAHGFHRMDGLGNDGQGQYNAPDVTSLRVVWRLGLACLCLAGFLVLLCSAPFIYHKGGDAYRAYKERASFKQVPASQQAETEMKKSASGP